MFDEALKSPVHAISVFGLLWVRSMVCLSVTPLFGLVTMPRSLRLAVATVMAAWLWPLSGGSELGSVKEISQPEFVLLVLKDATIGFLLGFTLAIPAWAAEGVGAMFDNQRGAMMGQTFNPLLNSPSTMALLLQYAAILVLYESGGLRWACEYITLSARVWPPQALLPPPGLLDQEAIIQLFNGMARTSVLYFAPLMGVMLMMELAMALLSIYAPHMQAFQLAMPVKSLVGLAVLTMLLGVMFELWSGEAPLFFHMLLDKLSSVGPPPASVPR